ncbi:hypothetical protein RE6C_02892 [Rhodopirellula europaea 6C]|uniref:Uncharacterized protein n=1 Tax=Rhodopirellula europaea 6C TaxID=1263867 RepID=M2AV11_9BACT|nr:hypothetical protein RE6C_02892 [Rhodopirellula europaea 6C]
MESPLATGRTLPLVEATCRRTQLRRPKCRLYFLRDQSPLETFVMLNLVQSLGSQVTQG